jgi:hypothetical protein
MTWPSASKRYPGYIVRVMGFSRIMLSETPTRLGWKEHATGWLRQINFSMNLTVSGDGLAYMLWEMAFWEETLL